MSTGFGSLPPGCTGAGCVSAANSEGAIVAAANNAQENCREREVFFIEGIWVGMESQDNTPAERRQGFRANSDPLPEPIAHNPLQIQKLHISGVRRWHFAEKPPILEG
jgi:hypothetical protein